MTLSGNVTITLRHISYCVMQWLLILLVLAAAVTTVTAQDSHDNVIVPFNELLQKPVELKPELKGLHPRVFFTASDITRLRERSKGADRDLWLKVIGDMRTLRRE